ncbi:uncharacterized protein LOC131320907 [Rhododendron vialii]|uniref:uncharacterized protein LOC131320907 n=1 Tax=Rhododendron vialii TaxID=182163 RepID=UPI00265EFA64|nr:uncharacterized protein LOC131320907 [Rhododendron vialii]
MVKVPSCGLTIDTLLALYSTDLERVLSFVFNLGRSLHSKVSSIVHNGDWKWPRQRNRVTQTIMSQTPPNFKPVCGKEDSVVWLPHPTGYSVHSAWEAIRTKLPIQQWTKIVWFSRNIPRWAFILWLAIQHKPSTKDRLFSWGMNVPVDCVFCATGLESHHHLFFHCPVSCSVWHTVWCKSSNSQVPHLLADVIAWYVQNVQSNSFQSVILKAALASTVYSLWLERNKRVFQHQALPQDRLLLHIINSIRDSLSSKRGVKPTQANKVLCDSWQLFGKIFGLAR